MEPDEGLLPIGTLIEMGVGDMFTRGVIDSYTQYGDEEYEPYIVKYGEDSYISCSKYDFSKITVPGTETKFKVGDVVWIDSEVYNHIGYFTEYFRKIGLVTKVEWLNGGDIYTIEIDSDQVYRIASEIYPLFDTNDLGQLSLDYKLILDQNQELLGYIKDTREWLERMVKLHNAMVRTIVAGERKILDTIKQEEE